MSVPDRANLTMVMPSIGDVDRTAAGTDPSQKTHVLAGNGNSKCTGELTWALVVDHPNLVSMRSGRSGRMGMTVLRRSRDSSSARLSRSTTRSNLDARATAFNRTGRPASALISEGVT